MRLDEIAHQCIQDAADWFPDLFEKSADGLINHYLIALAGEAGETLNKWKKYDRGSITREEMRRQLKDELADVFVYLMNLPLILGFDMEQEYNVKREFNRQRFGVSGSDSGEVPGSTGRDSRPQSGLSAGLATSRWTGRVVDVDLPGDHEVPE